LRFSAKFFSSGEWWRINFIFSVVNLGIWLGVGWLWWPLMGLTEAAEMENAFILSAESKNTQDECPESPTKKARRQSISSDDGCGLGRFMRRESFPSPRKVPVPGRLSRGSLDSACIDDDEEELGALQDNHEQEVILFEDNSVCSKPPLVLQESCEREVIFHEDSQVCSMTPQAMVEVGSKLPQVVEADEGSEPRDDCVKPDLPQSGEADEGSDLPHVVESDEGSESGDDCVEPAPCVEAEVPAPLPPASENWDWPLSRHEKKARVQMLERQMFAVDRSKLMQKLAELQEKQTDRRDSCSTKR